jgi:hypothetical protein
VLTREAVLDKALTLFLKNRLPELFSGQSDVLQLKYIEPDGEGGNSGWGVDYEWNASKSVRNTANPKNGEQFGISRLTYDLDIAGSYAFDDALNTQNLSTITAALKLERGSFGKLTVADAQVGRLLQSCLLAVPRATTPEEIPAYDRASAACMKAQGVDKIIAAEPGASFYWVDFHAALEANQDYSDSRTLFGLAGAYAHQPSVAKARYNLIDAPFRMLRNAFGSDSRVPYAAPFPSLLLGIERLDAKDDDTRTALTNDTTYTRGKAEIAFNTQIANISSQIVRFNASYRYFKELSAPAAIRSAGLDEFDFVTASLRFPARLLPFIQSDAYELFVSYTSGRLPFNPTSGQTLEVGFKTNIQTLAEFLAR